MAIPGGVSRVPRKQAPKPRKSFQPPQPEVGVTQGSRRAPQRAQSVNPAVNPRAAGPIAPKQAVRVRRNTAITQPLNTPAFARQQRQAARHVARSIIKVTTGTPGPQRPLLDHEVKAVLRSSQGRQIIASAEKVTRVPEQKHNRSFLQKAVRFAFLGPRTSKTEASLGGAPQVRLAQTAGIAGLNTGRAFVEDPIGVGTKTAAGAGQLAIGLIGAVPELAIRTGEGTAHGDPLAGVKQLGSQAAKDFSRRYGGIYRGDPGAAKAFRERVKKEGAASEIADLAAFAVPEGAIAGRAAGTLARAGRLGPKLERVATEARPALRISGEAARPQELSRNLIRAGAQRGEDALRRRQLAGRNAKAASRDRPLSGLQARPGEVVAATKAGQRRLQRIEASQIAARVFEGFKNEQAREIDQGARKSFSKLNQHQRVAATSAIQGLVTAHDPVAAVSQLKARNAAILAAREADTAERAKGGLGPRPVPDHLHGNELALNQYLIDNAKNIFNFKFAEFQKGEAARSVRVAAEQTDAHPVFKSSTAEVRRLRPQGEALSVPYQYELARHTIQDEFQAASRKAETDAGVAEARQVRDQALAALEERKPEIDARYAAEVRAKAQKAGLPEPGFVSHHPRPDYGFSDFAPGGAKAIAGVRRSELTLHRLGIADTHPSRYVQSLARTVKYKYNWPGVGAQADAHSFNLKEFGSDQELKDITGRKTVNPDSMTIEDLRRVIAAKGLDPNGFAFWNPGRLRKAKAELDVHGHPDEHLDTGNGPEGSPGVHEGWKAAAVDEKALRDLPADERAIYVQSRGWKLLPREAYNEITAGTRPSGAVARSIGKYQSAQSRVLLGLNPSWLQIQVAANALQSAFGVAAKMGNPADFVTATKLYNRQPADVRKIIDEGLSNGIFQAHGEHVHLGASANNDVVKKLREIGEHPVFQNAKRVNPMTLIFRGDHAQNAYFRKVVLASSLKREAFHDMGRTIGQTVDQQKKVGQILAIKDPEARLRAIVRDPQLFEKHAEYVNRILGDYSRFTARERRYLKRGILFYGFFRFSLQTLFYTLPVKHPLAAAAAAKLAQLHNDEVKDLLGGPEAPWAYSRVFFGKGAQLRSIDFARANPVTNPIIDIATEGPQALGGFVSPAIQAVTDQLYGKSLYSGQEFKVKGSASANPNPDVVTRARIAAADIAATAFPYREAIKLTQSGAKQGDDSLLFSPRPIHYKTAAAQERERVRLERAGSGGRQVARDLAPLAQPKPDYTRDIIAQRRRKAGGGSGGASNRYGFSLPGSSSGGSTSSGSSNRYGFNLP